VPDDPADSPTPPAARHLIITVHGIRTFGAWQERLEYLLKAKADPRATELSVTHYKFGYFSVIAFIIPFFRWIVTRRFRKTLERLSAKGQGSRIDLVGHSFGTHLIGWALRGLPESSVCKINTVILSGSVLRMDFPWSSLLDKRVERVVNDCGDRDAILLLSQFGVLFTGMAGRVGFTGDMTERFRNRFSRFGHSGYFQDQAGAPSDAYMRDRWVDLLLGDGPVSHFDDRPSGTAEGIITWLAANAEPIKLTV
jgi:pimeloyl-ACP methyl ester carboxylesterase